MTNDKDEAARSRATSGALTSTSQTELLARWASRYVWWKPTGDALRYPERIMAQVMNIGDYDDVLMLIDVFGEEALREIVRNAEAGQFNERSWAYWHVRLGLVPADASARFPPLPARRLS